MCLILEDEYGYLKFISFVRSGHRSREYALLAKPFPDSVYGLGNDAIALGFS